MKPLSHDHLRLSGDGMFLTVQGEGITAGLPAWFLRLHECNLACSWCDAWYTWKRNTPEYQTEQHEVELAEVAHQMQERSQATGVHRWVITGGEPLMQGQQLAVVMGKCFSAGLYFEIETNGTIRPPSDMSNMDSWNIQFNVSPKLTNSGMSRARAWKPDVLSDLSRRNAWFKFVVAEPNDVDEILELVELARLPNDRILVMAEGTTPSALHEHGRIAANLVIAQGWRVSPRLQIQLFGDVRAT